MIAFIKRLSDFYQRHKKPASGLWGDIEKHSHAGLIDTLETRNPQAILNMLDSFCNNPALTGIEGPIIHWGSAAMRNNLSKLAESIGVLKMPNPEQPFESQLSELADRIGAAERIGAELGFPLRYPDCFGYEGGKGLPHRFITYCAAAHIIQLQHGKPKHILEIGAGLGNFALIAKHWGSVLTVIDLPQIAVLSAYFAANVFGPEQVWLDGEGFPKKSHHALFFSSASYEMAFSADYDLAFNSDSLPEMPERVQDDYLKLIFTTLRTTDIFVSINHESTSGGQSSVLEATKRHGGFSLVARHPFHMRAGYVTETYRT